MAAGTTGKPSRVRRLFVAAIVAAGLAGIAVAILLAMRPEQHELPAALPDQDLGDYRVGTTTKDVPGEWASSWDCKEDGCAPGEARVISGPECLESPCARLRIYDDANGARDSVGFTDFHANRGGDGYGAAPERQGTASTWEWDFKFGEGFPTLPSETQYVNVTEWHSTGFNAPGHPLVIAAQQGQLWATSYGWDGSENRGHSAWRCMLASSYEPGVWYRMRVHAHWADVDGYLKVQLGHVGEDGWLATCIREDGMGNLFHDPNGRPDEIFMAQNLYRGPSYTRDMTIYYDNTRQDCSLADDGDC